jgi:hypothetical protein
MTTYFMHSYCCLLLFAFILIIFAQNNSMLIANINQQYEKKKSLCKSNQFDDGLKREEN